jgi:hypothetical protein
MEKPSPSQKNAKELNVDKTGQTFLQISNNFLPISIAYFTERDRISTK